MVLSKKSILSSLLAAGLVLSSSLPAFAATTGSYGTSVDIEVRNETMDMTVPTTLPMIFLEDGQNTLPSNWKVTNNSAKSNVYLSKIAVDGSESGWQVVADDYEISSAKDLKALELKMGVKSSEKLVAPIFDIKNTKGEATFQNTDLVINKGETKEISILVERGTFSHAIANSKAFDMTLEFEVKAD